jgi:SLOG family YspA-like protein
MKLAIVGSRSFTDYNFLETNILEKYNLKDIDEIVSGGAKGTDNLAESFAKVHNLKLTVFYPDWLKHGKYAGPLRNKQIVEYADEVIAFWDGSSPGTKSTINLTKQMNKKLHVIKFF